MNAYSSIPKSQRPALRTHSSASSTSSTSTTSSTSSISSASSAAHVSPQSRPIAPGSSNPPSALHHHHHQLAPAPRRTAGPINPLLMLVHPHPPIHTPVPPSLQDRRASVPNMAPLTAPLARDDAWLDNAEFQTPAGTPTSAPCSACSSPFFDPRPTLPLRKSADSALFPLHPQRH